MDLISQKGLETDQTESGCFSDAKGTQEPAVADSCSMKDKSVNTSSNSAENSNNETRPSPIPSTSQLPAFYSNSHSYVGCSSQLSFSRQYDQLECSFRWKNAYHLISVLTARLTVKTFLRWCSRSAIVLDWWLCLMCFRPQRRVFNFLTQTNMILCLSTSSFSLVRMAIVCYSIFVVFYHVLPSL